jgi:hypothetical protein
MIIYDGIYRMPDETTQGFQPRSQWAYAWQVRIINLNLSQTTVEHLRSRIVVVNQTGSKTCLTSCTESIGKKISRDFDLDVSRVLWVEHFPNNQKQWLVAAFKPKSSFGPDFTYHIQWRPIRPNEIDLIKPFISEINN